MDDEIFSSLFEPKNFVGVRGISCDLELLPMSGSTCTLELLPARELSSLFLPGGLKWELKEVPTFNEDPATAVIMRQEKLREYSAARFNSISEPKTSSQVEDVNPLFKPYCTEEYITESLQFLDEILDDRRNVPLHASFLYSPILPIDTITPTLVTSLKSPLSLFDELVCPRAAASSILDKRNLKAFNVKDNDDILPSILNKDEMVTISQEIPPPITETEKPDIEVVNSRYPRLSLSELQEFIDEDTQLLLAHSSACEELNNKNNNNDNKQIGNLLSSESLNFISEEDEMKEKSILASQRNLLTNHNPLIVGTTSSATTVNVNGNAAATKDNLEDTSDTSAMVEESYDTSALDTLLNEPLLATTRTTSVVKEAKRWATTTLLDDAEFEAARQYTNNISRILTIYIYR